METRGGQGHLPVFGVGPAYVVALFTTTALASVAAFFWLGWAAVNLNWLRLIFVVAGVIVAALAVVMWLVSVFGARVTENIENNQLITGGIYAWVRHPIYAAFLFLNAGILLVQANYVLLILPAVYWLALTVLMKRTEERWLRRQLGQQYVDYESCVNRIMPWPPR